MPPFTQRLYSAWCRGGGIHLSFEEIVDLLADDAIATRVTDEALQQLGLSPEGKDGLGAKPASSWEEFKHKLESERE
jgi:hypothetical protein